MKLKYLLLGVASLGLVVAAPHLKTVTQGIGGIGRLDFAAPAAPSLPEQPPAPKTETQIADSIFQRVNPAVVTVYCGKEIGSGSFISPAGWVLTTKHVVWSAPQISVKTADGKTYPAWIRAIDPQYDLAILELDRGKQDANQPDTKTQFPTVPLASQALPKPGQRVFAIGSPAGKAGTFTAGTFTRTNQHGSLQLSKGLLEPGNSGGPLLNLEGEMIGVNKGLLKDGSGLATSVTAARSLLERSQRAVRTQ